MTTRHAKHYRDLGRWVTEERLDLCRLLSFFPFESLSITEITLHLAVSKKSLQKRHPFAIRSHVPNLFQLI